MLHEERAQKALRANLTPRYLRLDRLERYVRGTQYDGRPSFYDDSRPLYERAPCIVYPIAATAIRSTVDLCLGEGRWPAITSNAIEDDENDSGEKPRKAKAKAKPAARPFDPRFALTEDESEALDKLVECIVFQAKLRTVCDELLDSAMASRTSVAICSVRAGRLHVDTTHAKWCKPEFDEIDPREVVSIEIRYPYLEEYFDERERKWGARCMLYRRVLDRQSDTTYKPVEAREDGAEPAWSVDASKTKSHGFGFCPVVWYRYRPTCGTVADYDGNAIHQDLLDEIDALNFALSQRHAAAMVAASPPTVEIGVDEDHNPAPIGAQPRVIIPNADDISRGYQGGSWVQPGGGNGGVPARKRGPNVVWRYPSETSKVDVLTIPGDALKPVDDDCRDLRSKIAEALGVVFVDPDNAKFSADISGKALARLYDRQIRLCDKVREDFGDNGLLRVVDVLLRIALSVGRSAPNSLYLPGLGDALPVLEKFEAQVEGKDGLSWFSPELDLTWGAYFAPDGAEDKALVEMVVEAQDAKLITQRTAVEKLAEVFDIGNVDEYLEKLHEEAEEAQESLMAAQQALGAAMGNDGEGSDDSEGVAKAAPPGAPQNASRGDAPAPKSPRGGPPGRGGAPASARFTSR